MADAENGDEVIDDEAIHKEMVDGNDDGRGDGGLAQAMENHGNEKWGFWKIKVVIQAVMRWKGHWKKYRRESELLL